MRISDWSSDVCSSDLLGFDLPGIAGTGVGIGRLALEVAVGAEFGGNSGDVFDRSQVRLGVDAGGILAELVDELGVDQAVLCGEIGRASCRERVCQYV